MLYRHHLASALDARREDFVRFERDWQAEARCYAEHLRALGMRNHEDVRRAALARTKSPGALPSAELGERKGVAVPFEIFWRSHEEARAWAIEILHERVTCAADGSQILPGRDISLPVAAVQAVVFENPHTRAGCYRKEAHFEVVAPEELLEGEGGQARAEAAINFRRFELETELLGGFLKKHAGWRERGERLPSPFSTARSSFLTPARAPRFKTSMLPRSSISSNFRARPECPSSDTLTALTRATSLICSKRLPAIVAARRSTTRNFCINRLTTLCPRFAVGATARSSATAYAKV